MHAPILNIDMTDIPTNLPLQKSHSKTNPFVVSGIGSLLLLFGADRFPAVICMDCTDLQTYCMCRATRNTARASSNRLSARLTAHRKVAALTSGLRASVDSDSQWTLRLGRQIHAVYSISCATCEKACFFGLLTQNVRFRGYPWVSCGWYNLGQQASAGRRSGRINTTKTGFELCTR